MSNSRYLRSLLFLLFITVFSLKAGLLPGSVVRTGFAGFANVEDLEMGDKLLSLDNNNKFGCILDKAYISNISLKPKSANRIVLLELVSDNGEVGFLYTGENQKFYNSGALARLKPKLLRNIKNKNTDFLQLLLRVIWVDAKNIRQGDELLGLNNSTVTVKNVRIIELSEPIDLYDISIGWPHTFFIVDSAGNSLLTHNIIIPVAVWIIGGAILGGAVAGAASVAYYTRGKISAKAVLSGAVVGGIVGGTIAAGIIYYKPVIRYFFNSKKLVIQTKPFRELASEFVSCEDPALKLALFKELFKKYIIFIKKTTKTFTVVIPGTFEVINTSAKKIARLFDISEADMDFNGIDKQEENNNQEEENDDENNENNDNEENKNVIFSSITIEALHDENGRPVRDDDGKLVPLFIARYEVRGEV